MNTTPAPRLTWHRHADGHYSTELASYAATITRSTYVTFDGRPSWHLHETTYGRFLAGGHHRTLAQARAEAQATVGVLAEVL